MADAEEDDYMTMTFGEDDNSVTNTTSTGTARKKKPIAETSLQRRIRLQREGRERGHMPSKAELAKAAEEEREAALSRSLFDAPRQTSQANPAASTSKWPPAPSTAQAEARKQPVNKGFAMMAKMGFVAGQSLGKRRNGEGGGESATEGGRDGGNDNGNGDCDDADRPVTEPIRIQVKRDRAGIGAAEEEKREKEKMMKEASEQDGDPDAKRLRLDDMDPLAYRDRLRQEREAGRLERQIHAAQVVAERMAKGDDDDDDDKPEMNISNVNVLWRGLVKERRTKERERTLRIKAQRLLDDRLRDMVSGGGGDRTTGGYAAVEQGESDGDGDDDGDDRVARGKGPGKSSFLDSGLKRSIAMGDDDDDDDDDDEGSDNEEDKDEELEEFNAMEPRERLQQVVDWMRQNRRYCFWCKYAYPDNALDGCPGPTEEDHD